MSEFKIQPSERSTIEKYRLGFVPDNARRLVAGALHLGTFRHMVIGRWPDFAGTERRSTLLRHSHLPLHRHHWSGGAGLRPGWFFWLGLPLLPILMILFGASLLLNGRFNLN